ncbi:MAG: ABC transporter permease [Candidatus Krumholzibacteria bacterium]|nr:ABC transporter permease [Candidatus Krumholzibacteria bacterium]
MRKMLIVVRREYLDRVKKKSFLIGTILGPVLMALLLFMPALLFRFSPEMLTSVAVIDHSGAIYPHLERALPDTLPDGSAMFRLREEQVDGATLEQTRRRLAAEVENDALDGYIVIPADVVETGKVVFYGKRVGDIKTLERIESALSTIVIGMRLSERGIDYGEVRGLVRNVDLEAMQIKEGGEERKGGFDFVFMSTYLFIMLIYMTILMWGVAVQRSIIEEKNSRIIEVLLSSLRPGDLLFGKILGVCAVGLTQYAIWGLFGGLMVAYGLAMGGQVAAVAESLSLSTLAFFILYYLLGFLFYAAMFAGVGSVCNTDQEAQQMQQPIMFPLIFTIVIPMLIIQRPDGMFATVISLIPFFTPVVMFMRINVLMPPLWQVALSVAIMIAGIWAVGRLSAKVFRTGILMYGKKPDAREILRWLRRA